MFPIALDRSRGQSMQGGHALHELIQQWKSTGIFTQLLAYSTIGLFIGSLFTYTLFANLNNNVEQTLIRNELWRPFTAGLVHSSALSLLFAFLALIPTCAYQEQVDGTFRLLVDFFFKNFEIHMLCNLLLFIISFKNSEALNWKTYGLWCFYMTYLTKSCLQNPNGSTILCFSLLQVPNMWCPFVFVLIFSILGGYHIAIALLISYVVALIHFLFLDKLYLGLLSSARIHRWENKAPISWLKKIPNYIGVLGDNVQWNDEATGSQSSFNNRVQNQNSVQPFSGRGIRLGGDDLLAITESQAEIQYDQNYDTLALNYTNEDMSKKGMNHTNNISLI